MPPRNSLQIFLIFSGADVLSFRSFFANMYTAMPVNATSTSRITVAINEIKNTLVVFMYLISDCRITLKKAVASALDAGCQNCRVIYLDYILIFLNLTLSSSIFVYV